MRFGSRDGMMGIGVCLLLLIFIVLFFSLLELAFEVPSVFTDLLALLRTSFSYYHLLFVLLCCNIGALLVFCMSYVSGEGVMYILELDVIGRGVYR
jgi:hypothetical protein